MSKQDKGLFCQQNIKCDIDRTICHYTSFGDKNVMNFYLV